ncbi:MAG: PDZ domain-containing protein, partial [Firmicutes bacterium]|nr:PDZ domain-containing protein [Candidatus Colimorpha enterica]
MKKIPLFLAILLITAAIVITFCATYVTVTEKHNAALNEIISSYGFFDKLRSVDATVRQNYNGEIDEEELQRGLINGYLSGLGDKYYAYMTADEYNTYMNEENGNSVGIGITVIYDNESGNLEVISVIENSPAMNAGLEPGDVITGVDGEDIAPLGYYGAVAKVKGEIGSTVDITFRRGNDVRTVKCTRGEIATESISYHVYSADPTVGVIRISEFNSTTPAQFKKAAEMLLVKGCTDFIFDLRNNGGGELNSIVSTLDYILPEGPIVHIFFADEREQHPTSDAAHLQGRFAVLVNENTASAAELFASAIKDYAAKGMIKAKLVGTVTYGKGVLQSFYI